MNDGLPKFADPIELASKKSRFIGEIPIDKMPRLLAYLSSSDGVVSFELEFYQHRGRCTLNGKFSAQLSMICQRSLNEYKHSIQGTWQQVVVQSESDELELPDTIDALYVNSDGLNLQNVVEDEVILSLPLVPIDPSGKELEAPQLVEKQQVTDVDSKKANPFLVLKNFKI